MPLHAEREGFCAVDPHGLDCAVSRYRLNDERWRQLVNTLPMQGIDDRFIGSK